MNAKAFLKKWRFTLILAGSVSVGALLGYIIGPKSAAVKPLGDLLLNLLFTAVVPLVFFSLSSAVAASRDLKRLGRIAGLMLGVFIITGVLSSCLMLCAVKTFDPAGELTLGLAPPPVQDESGLADKIAGAVSVPDFADLLNRRNILALIVFSILTGLACQAAGEKAQPIRSLLVAGAEVMGQLIRLIMLYAPIGLGAYFAYMVGVFGPQIVGSYARVLALYYPVAILYFVLGFSLYAFSA
ncbi:MAG: cation:dicarboxylase symporter family transporter, partial [Planctomycetes bacterium]|nr:cation:dicarboxylase symporter family transporter [Planctomycetota bacterium]